MIYYGKYNTINIFNGVDKLCASYVDKHLMNLGISGKDYFYYMCFSMIPFSFIVIIVKIILGQFKFELKKENIIFILSTMLKPDVIIDIL